MTVPIDTAKVRRRPLKFESLGDVRAELGRIEAAQKSGNLRAIGNWTPGQVFNHLATWGDYPYDGYPAQLNPPWFVKLILRMMKKKFFKGPMPGGARIPGIEAGTMGTEVVPFDEALARYRRTIQRYESAPPPRPNIIFGALSHDQWKALQLRHAELHLGFLVPG